MVYDLDDDIQRFTIMRDELQAEIDALTDQHRVISRALAALQGVPDEIPDGWVPAPDVQLVPSPPPAKNDRKFTVVGSEPKPKSQQATKKNGPATTRDYPAIAEWINKAKADGTYSQEAMERHFGVPRTTVKNWLVACKKRGLLNDPQAPRTHTPHPAGYVSRDAVAAAEAATT